MYGIYIFPQGFLPFLFCFSRKSNNLFQITIRIHQIKQGICIWKKVLYTIGHHKRQQSVTVRNQFFFEES